MWYTDSLALELLSLCLLQKELGIVHRGCGGTGENHCCPIRAASGRQQHPGEHWQRVPWGLCGCGASTAAGPAAACIACVRSEGPREEALGQLQWQ